MMGARLFVRCAVITASAMLAGLGGAGVASAQPDLGPLVNTTCTYSQVISALNAEAPDLGKELSSFPAAQARLQSFLSAPVDQRQQMAQSGIAGGQQYQGVILQVANSCSQY